MKNKLWKEIIVAVLLVSTILSFTPIAHGQTTSVQQSIDAVKMEMKQAALAYVDPALKGNLVPSSSLNQVLNSVKKNYEETKKLILASNLSEKEKQAKLKELEALYEEKIVKGLIPYIDAYNYATKYLDPLLKEIKEAEAKNDFLAVEKAYHKLSVQLKSRTSILYRFTGKAPRDLLLEKYKKPADKKRDDMVVPVTIIMKVTNAQQLLLAGKKEAAIKAIEDVPSLVAKLSSTNAFHQALLKELERLQAIVFPPPVTPVIPTPPVTPPSTGGSGDSGGSSETSAQRALRLAKTDAIKELTDYKVNVTTDYSAANWAEILILKTIGKNAINSSKTTSEVTKAFEDAKTEINKIPTTVQEVALALDKAKADAIAELADYKVEADYSAAKWAEILNLKTAGTNAINSAETIQEVTDAKDTAKAALDLIQVKSNVSTVSAITVKGIATTVDVSDSKMHNVELPIGAILTNLTATDIEATPTDAKATIGDATPADNGATWQVVVTSENGKSSTTYTIKVTVNNAPTVANAVPNQNGTVGNKVTIDLSNVFTDADKDTLTIVVNSGTLTGTMWSYIPVTEDAGKKITVTLTANDGKGGAVQNMFTVAVGTTKQSPIIVSNQTHTVPLAPPGYKLFNNGSSSYGIVLENYTYWPFAKNDNSHYLIIVAYDSDGNEKKRFSYPGYRYVSSITIDSQNQTFQFAVQDNTLTIPWSDLIID